MRLSIIVPVYNVEKYLEKCLNSLFNQDITELDYEIIIVNDGSPDGSLKIAESFQQKHKNIKIISQENRGLSAARNTGIDAAQGKYIMFVDSDDFIEPNILGAVLEEIEIKKLDALRFNYQNVNEDYNILPKSKNATRNVTFDTEIVTGEKFLTDKLGWAFYVCVYLFRTDFVKSEKFYFKEGIYFEDVEWLFRLLLKLNKISSIDLIGYNYLQRIGSITQSVEKSKHNKIVNDKLFIVSFLLGHKRDNKKQLNKWIDGMISITMLSLVPYIYEKLPERRKELIDYIEENRLKPFRSYKFTIKQKKSLLFLNLSMEMYGKLIIGVR